MNKSLCFIFAFLIYFSQLCCGRLFSEEQYQLSEAQKDKIFHMSGLKVNKSLNLKGVMNTNFLVENAEGKQFVLKILEKAPEELISRENEYYNQNQLCKEGLSPFSEFFSSPDFSFSLVEFLKDAQILTTDKQGLLSASLAIAKLHSSGIKFRNHFGFLLIMNKAKEVLKKHALIKPEDDKWLEKAFLEYEQIFNRFRHSFLKPCHNDLNRENLLIVGKDIKIIDWEFSSMNDPAWEISYFLMINRVPKEEWKDFIASYLQSARSYDSSFSEVVLFYRPYVLLYMATILSYKLQDKKLSKNDLINLIRECLQGTKALLNSQEHKNNLIKLTSNQGMTCYQ